MMSNWTKEELMICAAADVIQDHDVALVGIGLPTLAAMVAKQTNAPNLQMIFESGAIDAVPNDLPQGPGDFPLLRTSVMTTSLFNALGYVQRGKVDVAFLGAAEIDQYGNLNATGSAIMTGLCAVCPAAAAPTTWAPAPAKSLSFPAICAASSRPAWHTLPPQAFWTAPVRESGAVCAVKARSALSRIWAYSALMTRQSV